MLYVVSRRYVGEDPTIDRHHRFYTMTETPYTLATHKARDRGYCGTENDWVVRAHGTVWTVEEAERLLAHVFKTNKVGKYTFFGEKYPPGVEPYYFECEEC